MTFFSTADRLEIGGVPFITPHDKPTRREALRYYQRLAADFHLDVRQYHEVEAITGSAGAFRVAARSHVHGATQHEAENVVIATGYFDSPNLLGVPGEELPHVLHAYREGHAFYDQDVVIVGGGNSAADGALELHRWGARVTLVHFADALDPNVKPWIRPDIEARLREGAIAARFATRIAAIKPGSVTLREEAAGATSEIRADWVLVLTGYTPDGRLLRSLGVDFDPQTGIPRHDPATMETGVPGVFVAGVITAGFNANKVFIENGRDHGPRIAAVLAP
jgi:thioredoxin reductase (NADPH)